MSAKQLTLPANRAFDSDGAPATGARAFLYLSGTSTPAPFYDDVGLTISLGSVITANSAGRFTPMPYQESTTPFRLVIEDEEGAVLDDIDPYYFGQTVYDVAGSASTASRTTLAAIVGSLTTVVVLTEANREGEFYWDSSNLSTQVTADPGQGIYVPPATAPTGASGSWVRKYTGAANVKWFGAVGDGVTNDTTAIQRALNLVNHVYVPAGTWVASNLKAASNRVIEGAGASTILKALANQLPNIPVIRNLTNNPATSVARDTDITVKNLVIDGNKANNATQLEWGAGMLWAAVNGLTLSNVYIKNPHGDGITLLYSYDFGGPGITQYAVGCSNVFLDVRVEDADRQGVTFTCAENVTGRLITKGSRYFGLDMEPDSVLSFIRNINLNHLSYQDGTGTASSGGIALTCSGGSENVNLNFVIYEPNGHGVQWRDAKGLSLKGSIVRANGAGLNGIDGGSIASSVSLDVIVNTSTSEALLLREAVGGTYTGRVISKSAGTVGGASTQFTGGPINGELVLNLNTGGQGVIFNATTGNLVLRDLFVTGHTSHNIWFINNASGMRVYGFKGTGSTFGAAVLEAAGSDNNHVTDAIITGGYGSGPVTLVGANSKVRYESILEGGDLVTSTVSYAKIQNVSATDKLLGRSTAGAGVIEEITCTAAGRALIDDADAAAQRTTLGLAAVASSGSASDLSTGTLLAARMPALTGDITSTVGTVATTLATNIVTYAKFQQVAASSLVGNPTGSLANAQGITLAADLAFSGSALQVGAFTGDITKAAGSLATSIGANKVTLGMLANLSTTGKLLGSSTASSAAAEISVGTGLTIGTSTLRFANVSATTLLGNPTGGATTPSEITLAGGLSFSGTTITLAGGALAPASIAATGAITSSGGGIGYATGAGGTVTQLTSKATGVTLDKLSGDITLNAAALAASTTVSFVFTNNKIAAGDTLILNHSATGTFGSYTLNAHGFAAGSCTIDVRNVSLGSLSEAIVIRYAVIKAVQA